MDVLGAGGIFLLLLLELPEFKLTLVYLINYRISQRREVVRTILINSLL